MTLVQSLNEAGKGHRDAATSLCKCPGVLPVPEAWQHCPPAQAEIPHHQKKSRVTHMIRFLSCVDSKVTFEGLQVPEACAADLTGVRLLPGVNEHVSTEVGHLQRADLGQDSSREDGISLGARVSMWEWGFSQTSFLVCWVIAGSQGHVSEL